MKKPQRLRRGLVKETDKRIAEMPVMVGYHFEFRNTGKSIHLSVTLICISYIGSMLYLQIRIPILALRSGNAVMNAFGTTVAY